MEIFEKVPSGTPSEVLLQTYPEASQTEEHYSRNFCGNPYMIFKDFGCR